jgi:hypothetical protein
MICSVKCAFRDITLSAGWEFVPMDMLLTDVFIATIYASRLTQAHRLCDRGATERKYVNTYPSIEVWDMN